MGVFVRAVVTGFGFSLGAAIFKRLSKQLGLEEKESKPVETVDHNEDEQTTDPAPKE